MLAFYAVDPSLVSSTTMVPYIPPRVKILSPTGCGPKTKVQRKKKRISLLIALMSSFFPIRKNVPHVKNVNKPDED